MASSVAEYNKGVVARILRDMRSDIQAGWWEVAKRRALQILELDPEHQEAKKAIAKADAEISAAACPRRQKTASRRPRNAVRKKS